MAIEPYADNFIPVVPIDYMLHDDGHSFCPADPTCPCHEDPLLIAEVAQDVSNGLCTPEEATRIVKGVQI
ncbi:MAG TPA: hypothetical protein VNG51_10255 [Ktedonobacteraceae bacterium]|nr:hypothetical protein [Ktedonobacteraceae bacterium]